MSDNELLAMIKVDLGLTVTNYDERLLQYIAGAKKEIAREGAEIKPEDIDHCNLIVMYAAWMWRNRDTGTGMPRMVRYALNNLVLSQKMAGEKTTGGGTDD